MALIPGCMRFLSDRRGQDLMEYALMGGLVASVTVAIIPEMFSIAGHITQQLQDFTQVIVRPPTLKEHFMRERLAGKTALSLGVANKWSLAYAIAQAVRREGAKLLLTYQSARQ